jgi:hypothetical protein
VEATLEQPLEQEEKSGYHIYLLTVWQEPGDASGQHWRYRLEDPQSGRRYAFITTHALPFVLQQLRHMKPASGSE